MRPGPVFCLLLRVSSDYAQSITGRVNEVTVPVIGRAQPELTPSMRQKMGPDHWRWIPDYITWQWRKLLKLNPFPRKMSFGMGESTGMPIADSMFMIYNICRFSDRVCIVISFYYRYMVVAFIRSTTKHMRVWSVSYILTYCMEPCLFSVNVCFCFGLFEQMSWCEI